MGVCGETSSEIHLADYKNCNASDGEDPNCADAIKIFEVVDHGTYMGVNLLQGVPHRCLWLDP